MSDALQDALAHHQAGRHALAEALYSSILEASPSEPTALYLSGLLNCETGVFPRATQRLQALVAVQPQHIASQWALANLHALANDAAAASAGFRRVIALAPDHAGAQLGLGEALLALGQPAMAVAPCACAHRLQPGDERTALALFRALHESGRPNEALAAIDDLRSCDGWLARGAGLKTLFRLPEAAAAVRQAAALDPRRSSAWLNLGNLCAEMYNLREAEQHLRQAIACDAGSAEAHASLGSVLLLAGQTDAAAQCLHQALALDPAIVAAHQNLAAILTEQRRHANAQHHRDLAYRRQNVFVEVSAAAVRRVLLLVTAAGGNVPTQFLFSRARNTRITWVVEYACADQHLTLPPYDLVFNAIGDPDMAAGSDPAVAHFLRHCDRPVLNHPAQVARTCRHLLADLLAGIEDVVVPAMRRLTPNSLVAAAGLPVPLLVRPAGSHGGSQVTLVESTEQAAALRIAGPQDGYVTRFHDYRSDDGHYRKYRVIFVDREPHAYHLAIGDHWLVHYLTADMLSKPAKRDEESRFLADPMSVLSGRAITAIRAIGQALDLDFCGVDFALLADGQVLVFEANATMLVHPEDAAGVFAYKNPRTQDIMTAFDRLVDRKLQALR